MKTHTHRTEPKKATRTLDEEIAALQEKLVRLQAQKREKERKELERNQKAIAALLRSEKLDMVPSDRWIAALPMLRRLLKVDEPNGVSSPVRSLANEPAPTASASHVQQSAAAAGTGNS
jgi:hypothetical protein